MIFKVFKVVTLALTPKKRSKSLTCKRSHTKKYRKKFVTVMYLKILVHPYRPSFGRAGFCFFFFQNTVRLFPKRHNTEKEKKNCIKCAIAAYDYRIQSLRCTNNANEIREISPKKFWLLSWTPQRFRQIDAPVGHILPLYGIGVNSVSGS